MSDHKNNINNGPRQHRRSCRSGRRGRSTASIFCRSILSIGPSGTAARADPRYNNKINNDNDIYCYDNPNNINIVNNNNNIDNNNNNNQDKNININDINRNHKDNNNYNIDNKNNIIK